MIIPPLCLLWFSVSKTSHYIGGSLSIDLSTIVMGATIISDLEIDSINYVELILAVETEFDIEITDDDESLVSTVEDLVNLVISKIAKNSTAEKADD